MFKEDIPKAFIKAAAELGDVEICWDQEIQAGDDYFALSKTGIVKLLKCKSNNTVSGFIVPMSNDYCFDTYRCVKVMIK